MALLLRSAGSKVLKENPKISDPYPNVDAISGVLLSAAGFPYAECFRFCLAWPGWWEFHVKLSTNVKKPVMVKERRL